MSLYAQRNSQTDEQPIITVSGKILEAESNIPLEFATVTFLNSEGAIVEGGITDGQGSYAIEVPAGTYTIRYEFISYKTESRASQKLIKNTQLPTCLLYTSPSPRD